MRPNTTNQIRDAVMAMIQGIPQDIRLTMFEASGAEHNLPNPSDGERLMQLINSAFNGITLSNGNNEVVRKTSFLHDAYSLINRLTGRAVTVRLLDVSVDNYNPNVTRYPLSIIINKEKGNQQ